MATRFQGGLNSHKPELNKWADCITDDLRAFKRINQAIDIVLSFNNFIFRRFKTNNTLSHHLFDTIGTAANRCETNVLIYQPVHYQHAGITTGAIYYYGIVSHFIYS